MATQEAARPALPAGARVHHRAFFGFFDADGWAWAGVKAFAWFIFIILFLGYIPDRAYYFTVNRTIDLGIMFWSPVNLCPAENRGLPCPAPAGAIVPWTSAPAELKLPAGRVGGTAVQLGTHVVYIGGSDGSKATASTEVSNVQNSVFSAWADGPALPEARTDFGATTLSGVAYVIGGDGPDGKPTNTVWALPTVGDKGDLGTWAAVKDVTLPEARSGASVIAVTDGLLVAGGRGPDGTPVKTVWKATVDSKGVLGAFVQQADLVAGVADAGSGLVGEYVYVWGGTDANGPTDRVQIAHFGAPGSGGPVGAASSGAPVASGAAGSSAPITSAAPAASGGAGASAAPSASAAPVQGVQQWASGDPLKLPAPRTQAANFASNGTIYVVGGSDGKGPQSQVYWAVPDATGNIPTGWSHLDITDLPAGGLAGASAVVNGPNVYVFGGQTSTGLVTSSESASLAPIAPFFQLGPFGLVVPALQIPGEIGQQLGYLTAAGAATGNFVILVILGWAFNHKPVVRAWIERRRNRRRERVRS
jgi:hypothetical protein